MSQHVEVTRAFFNAIVDAKLHFKYAEQGESTRKVHYHADGVNLLVVENYASMTTQYYVQDINA